MSSLRSSISQGLLAIAVTLACLVAATQWAAAMLGYQAALGHAWIDLAGSRSTRRGSCSPGGWRSTPRHPACLRVPAPSRPSGELRPAWSRSGEPPGGPAVSNKPQPTARPAGRTLRMSRKAGLLGERGVVLGLYRDRYLRHDGPEHVLAVAPTRSGKGVGLVVPTLLTWPGSAIVHDIKGENWLLTAGWRAQFSHCLLFDPTNPLSARFNPLLEVRQGAHEVRDVQNIADILVDPEGAQGAARSLGEDGARAADRRHPARALCRGGEDAGARRHLPGRSVALDPAHAQDHADHQPPRHRRGAAGAPGVASIARELLNKSDNERSGVVSTAMSFLGLYRDPLIATNTARSDWRIADLMQAERPVSLYLVVPPSDISRTKPLVRLILNQIARRLTETLRRSARRRADGSC